MLETLSTSKPKARKKHTCMWCGGIIEKGEIYDKANLKYDDYLYTWKNHLKCSELCSSLDMCHDGEGITDDIFMEYVQEYIRENMSEDEWEEFDLYGEEVVDKAIEILKINKDLERDE